MIKYASERELRNHLNYLVNSLGGDVIIQGFTMRSSCAPYKDCLQHGGNKKETIIITVPHSECIDQYENVCDQSSLCRGKQIEGILKSNGYNVIFLRPNIHRINCDLNRVKCENTLYIQKFKRILKENPESIHFDVHSYPKLYSFQKSTKLIFDN